MLIDTHRTQASDDVTLNPQHAVACENVQHVKPACENFHTHHILNQLQRELWQHQVKSALVSNYSRIFIAGSGDKELHFW